MKQLTCEMCGGTDLIKQEGVFVCQSCNSKYSVEEAKKMMVEGTVEVKGKVKVDSDFVINSGELKKYNGAETHVVIPDTVRVIGKTYKEERYHGAFEGQGIESVVIPDSVTSIGDKAFYNCSSLTKINIPESVKSIGDEAFIGCSSLTRINIPDSVTSIGAAFLDCSSLTRINIPDSVTSIGDAAFLGCINLDQPSRDALARRGYYGPYKQSCYIATCVYGSYDCPEVWILRRFRDDMLKSTWYGRVFVNEYYKIGPKIVELFGNSNWFVSFTKKRLDKMVAILNHKGVENTPYIDR